jgi:thiol-disulfide isomerase/thioredoxin
MKSYSWFSLALFSMLAACNPPATEPEPAHQAAVVNEPVTEPGSVQPPAEDPGAHGPADHAAHEAEWLSLAAGRELAATENRNLLVYVYADWCARCRELEPVIESSDVMAASSGLIHVRHNSDVDDSSWLREAAQDRDGYVPRVLFLRSDGTRLPLVSDHPRYPLFYTPAMIDTLMANIQQAQQGS